MLKYKKGAIKKRLHSLTTTKSGFCWYKSLSDKPKPTHSRNPLNQYFAFVLCAGGFIRTINANIIKHPATKE
jgi:hypothetical protein